MENKFRCSNCQKDFSQQDIAWVKKKGPVCYECQQIMKHYCSWCQRSVENNEGWKCKRADRQDFNKYYCDWFCNDECKNNFEENTPEKVAEKQKRQELIDKGYKPCPGEGPIPFLVGLEKCGTLIPPTEKLCESCQKLQHERAKKAGTEKDLVKRKKEHKRKYQQAQNWWNSLSLTEKQAEIKKLEEEWIKKAGRKDFEGFVEDGTGSSIKFKDGKLHVYPEDLSKIPLPLLERFRILVYPRSKFFNVSEIFPSYNNDLEAKINNLETKLQEAKKAGNKVEISNLEREIQVLKDQQKNNFSSPSPNTNYWPWIIGIIIVFLVVLGFWIARRQKKVKK